ncbi:hypothetical protein O181_038337 [Austropuccinia psidii MF-1]|uniref:Reverse transcriptase RNase H-like domain-containing protein n=1 Tax=Austropuccinia psidii MF-1 TaxID=1389203 RepID=A0A9Q3DAR2_9BASI|nr:hypothetical protein [Austropuccinia psidii MF-1]
MLRRPPYPESLETRKEIEKHINELLEMDLIINIGRNELVEITTPVLITWHDGKSRLCGDFRALNNYTKADRYPIPRIPHFLKKLAKEKYITKMDCTKGFVMSISSSLYRLCSKDVVFRLKKEGRDADGRIKHEITHAPVLILPAFELPFKLYIDAACSQGLGEALHQRQMVEGEPREGVICYISRKLTDSEARYGTTQIEFLCLVWAIEKLHYYLEGAVFAVYTDCTALKSLLNMRTTNKHMLR